MRMGKLLAALSLITVAGFGLAACSGDDDSTTAESTASGRTLPESLVTLEEAAEDIIDQVPGANWEKIDTDVADMAEAWQQYEAQAAADGASQDRITELDAALTRLAEVAGAKDGPATAQAANDVSRPIVELFALYDIGPPVQVGRLDVIGRQIVLAVDAGDLSAASDEVANAQAEWDAIAKDVSPRDRDVAAEIDATIDALRTAAENGDSAALTTNADALLELVDAVEVLY
jgi:hypothetical protein